MPTAAKRNAGSSKKNGGTVRQTIVETVEAPRLQGVETSDFVSFKEKREVYERQVAEKNAETGIEIPLTTYRNSIDLRFLELLVWFDWVPVDDADEITEEHLCKCIEDRATVDPGDYDLALIEHEIRDVKLGKSDRNTKLETQVWNLCLKYNTKLHECGYKRFVKEQPKLAVQHVMKRITHPQLHTRMVLALKLRKKELEESFGKFVKIVADEAKVIDRHESTENYKAEQLDSEDDGAVRRQDSRPYRSHRARGGRGRNKAKGSAKETSSDSGNKETHSGSQGVGSKRPRELRVCLHPNCDKRHYIRDCDIATEDEKKKYLDEYHEKKRRRDGKKYGKPKVGGLSTSGDRNDNSSLFSATFCDGHVDCSVLADQGSDVNVLPPALLPKLLKVNPDLKVDPLKEKRKFDNARTSGPPMSCRKMVQTDVELRIRHGDKLMLRRVKWLISDNELAYAYIGRQVLAALGLDNRVMLAAAHDRLGGIVDVPGLLKSAGHKDDPCADGATSIGSILRERGFEWGSTFHSEGGAEEDKLEESDVYVDLGDDPPAALDRALAAMLERARANGLSATGAERLADLLKRYRSVFEFGWGKPHQPTSNQ